MSAGATPIPVRNTDWLAPGPLSETVRVACRMPRANGVRVTLIVELAPIAAELPQLLLCANSVVCLLQRGPSLNCLMEKAGQRTRLAATGDSLH